MAQESGMGFGTYLANGFRMLAFKKEAVSDIINDANHKKNAFLLVTLISALFAIFMAVAGSLMTSMGLLPADMPATGATVGMSIAMFFLVFFALLISCGIVHIFARLLKGKANIIQYFSAYQSLTFAGIVCSIVVTIIGMIPYIGGAIELLFQIFYIVVLVFVIREAYQFSTGRAVAALLIPIAIVLVLMFLLFAAVFSAFLMG